MHQVNDKDYLAFQVVVLCVLLFLVCVSAITLHPDWFK